MPITTIIILCAIVMAFALFGAVLAWGETQTRHLNRDQQRARKTAQAAEFGESHPGQSPGCRRDKREPPTRSRGGLNRSSATQNPGVDASGFFVSKGFATVRRLKLARPALCPCAAWR